MLNKARSTKQIWERSIPAVIIIYADWMLIYGLQAILDLIQNHHATLKTVCSALIKNVIFGQYHTWFIAALIALYMITPFLCRIVDDKALMQYFILLSIIFTIVLPSLKNVSGLDRFNAVITDTNMHFVVGYSLYFVLGYYLSCCTTNAKERVLLPIVLLAAVCFALYFSNAGIARGLGGDVQNYYSEFSICGFLICICVFRIFMNADGLRKSAAKALPYKLITHIASCGMAIYLMHPLLLPLTQKMCQQFALAGAVLLWLLSLLIATIISITPLNRLLIKWKPKVMPK